MLLFPLLTFAARDTLPHIVNTRLHISLILIEDMTSVQILDALRKNVAPRGGRPVAVCAPVIDPFRELGNRGLADMEPAANGARVCQSVCLSVRNFDRVASSSGRPIVRPSSFFVWQSRFMAFSHSPQRYGDGGGGVRSDSRSISIAERARESAREDLPSSLLLLHPEDDGEHTTSSSILLDRRLASGKKRESAGERPTDDLGLLSIRRRPPP